VQVYSIYGDVCSKDLKPRRHIDFCEAVLPIHRLASAL